MRKTRKKKGEVQPILEGVYDFYEVYDPTENSPTSDKIINYYIDKIRKYGMNSLTKAETQVFNDAKKGKLSLDKPIYKKDKLTGDLEIGPNGPVRIDTDSIIPGIPFITSKGKGAKKAEMVPDGRCYWDVDEDSKTFYVYGGEPDTGNPNGLVIWKTISASGKEFGAFIVPKGEARSAPADLWKSNNKKYDKGIILDKDTYNKFLEFDRLYHESKKKNRERLIELYDILIKYPQK